MTRRGALGIGIISSLLFVLVFMGWLLPNLNRPYMEFEDTDFAYFMVGEGVQSIITGNIRDIWNTRMFYPQTNTRALSSPLFTQILMSLPFYLVSHNAFFSFNAMILLGFFLSYLAMYVFMYHLTKNIPAAVIAGVLFTYNPETMAHIISPQFLLIGWFPLAFWMAEKIIIRGTRWIYMLSLGIILLLQLMTRTDFALYLLIALAVYVPLRILLLRRPIRTYITLQAVLTAVLVGATVFFSLKPMADITKKYNFQRPIPNTLLFLTDARDFVTAPPFNIFYKWLSRPNVNVEEHSLFAGTLALILGALGIIFLMRTKKYILLPFLAVGAAGILLSLGPYFTVNNHYMPMPYMLLYRYVPFINSIRAPIRIIFLTQFSLLISVGFAWAHITGRLPVKRQILYTVLAVFLLIIEYRITPIGPYRFDSGVTAFYSWLNTQNAVSVVLELPIGNFLPIYPSYNRPVSLDSIYLLYAELHNKKLVNGLSSFQSPASQRLGDILTIHFPTADKITYLKKLGVNLIIVHLEEYPDTSVGESVVSGLRDLGLKEVYGTGPVHAFLIN